MCSPGGRSDGSAILSSSFFLSILIDDLGSDLASTSAVPTSISSAFNTSSRTGARTFSLTVSVPVKVNLSMFGMIRIEYSVGTTCFGNLPGVLSKLNGFSAFMPVIDRKNNTAKKYRARISAVNSTRIYSTTKTNSNCPPPTCGPLITSGLRLLSLVSVSSRTSFSFQSWRFNS